MNAHKSMLYILKHFVAYFLWHTWTVRFDLHIFIYLFTMLNIFLSDAILITCKITIPSTLIMLHNDTHTVHIYIFTLRIHNQLRSQFEQLKMKEQNDLLCLSDGNARRKLYQSVTFTCCRSINA